jgi:hypothetical protein
MKGGTFSAYSDESGTFTERFQAIAVVTGQDIVLSQLTNHLKRILADKRIPEVKFALIRTHRPIIEAAQEFVQCFVKEFASKAKARVDVLVWDVQDSRHAVQGRDDAANLERMYYKVLTHAARRWNQAEWNFYPDENSQIRWHELAQVLDRTRLSGYQANSLLLLENERVGQLLQIRNTEPRNSVREPLIQLADLFAGMGCFTRREGENCVKWLDSRCNKDQLRFANFFCEEPTDETIKTKQNRFQLVGEFKVLCDQYGMGVSLREKRYLCTFNPTYPINFWNYEPQHELDQAPKRTYR